MARSQHRPPVRIRRVMRAENITGLDGKGYPRRPATSEERLEVVAWVHDRVHAGLSYRQVVAELEAFGARRSLGTVASYVTNWVCPDCVQVADFDAPEQHEEVAQ